MRYQTNITEIMQWYKGHILFQVFDDLFTYSKGIKSTDICVFRDDNLVWGFGKESIPNTLHPSLKLLYESIFDEMINFLKMLKNKNLIDFITNGNIIQMN